jgi:hypothetical protein
MKEETIMRYDVVRRRMIHVLNVIVVTAFNHCGDKEHAEIFSVEHFILFGL